MSANNQVMRFAMVDFEGDAIANPLVPADVISYTIQNQTQLLVAFEGAPGVFTTYRYLLEQGDVLFIYNNIIHIPRRCVDQQPNNTIRCQG